MVKDISIFYNKFDLVKGEHHNMFVPIKGTSKLIKSDSSEVKNEYLDDLKASGYVILFEDITVKSVK